MVNFYGSIWGSDFVFFVVLYSNDIVKLKLIYPHLTPVVPLGIDVVVDGLHRDEMIKGQNWVETLFFFQFKLTSNMQKLT